MRVQLVRPRSPRCMLVVAFLYVPGAPPDAEMPFEDDGYPTTFAIHIGVLVYGFAIVFTTSIPKA